MSETQSVLFDNEKWNTIKAMRWLKNHNIKPLKRVHKTEDKLRYRVNDPSNYSRFRTKKLGGGIELVLGFKSKSLKIPKKV